MKIKVAHFDPKIFKDKLQHLSHLDFSLFIDTPPQTQDELSPINIISFQEPNEYFGLHDWVIKNKNLFNIILTWDDKVLTQCSNAVFQPFGSTWLKPEQYKKTYPKKFQVAHVRGNLLKTYGHSLRFEYHERSQSELKIPHKSWETAGIREKIDTCAIAKCELFGDSQFGVAIENTSYRGYFTEKIMELFLLRTIPIYWGCSNIGDFFNMEGIITVHNIDDAIYALNNLDENYYNDRINVIEENYQKALQYVDYEQNIVNSITEIFKHNKLI